MRFTVLWSTDAERDLIDIWISAENRTDITESGK
jgi:hypothetical protein